MSSVLSFSFSPRSITCTEATCSLCCPPPRMSSQKRRRSTATLASPDHPDDQSTHPASDTADEGDGSSSLTACIKCKTRKVKCDKARPSCGWCRQNGQDCWYNKKQKPGPPRGSAQELVRRIDHLESMLQSLGDRLDHGPQRRPGPSSIEVNEPDINGHTPIPAVLVSRESIPEASPAMGDSSPAVPESHVNDFPSDSPFRENLMSGDTLAWAESTLSPPSGLAGKAKSIEPGLPPRNELYILVDLYFKHINTWSPLLDRSTTFDILSTSSVPDEADFVLLYAIAQVTMKFSQNPRHTPQLREQFHATAKRRIQVYGLEHTNIKALQALLLLAINTLGTSNGPEGMNILALIARNLTNLGLGHEQRFYLIAPKQDVKGTAQAFTLQQPQSWIEDEERRRLLWIVYAMDRYATAGTTGSFVLDESLVDTQLPCRYDLFSRNEPVETRWFRRDRPFERTVDVTETLGSFSHHCEVMRILTQVHDFMRTPLDVRSVPKVDQWKQTYTDLDSYLAKWAYSLPGEFSQISQFCHSDTKSKISNWIILHAAFVITSIRLHSPAAFPPLHSELFQPSYSAMQKCLAAVTSLKELVMDVIDTNMLDLLGPVFADAMWIAARLLIVHASIPEHRLNHDVFFFIAALDQMSQYWPVCDRYTSMLQCVLVNHMENIDPAGSGAMTGSHSPSHQHKARMLGNMRKVAYNIPILMSERRTSVLHPSIIKPLASHELEYFDVFGSFNYPRLPTAAYRVSNYGTVVPIEGSPPLDFKAPDPQSDWTTFRKEAEG
ncbi:hypothetical protein BP6252_13715 [Coleophoma cylindrospora]|uniref:Zn(2)-C6 fungal-type domain-containing protein n=1 Tax=Coleophoma cylindrospora TaxID=1849047 RepID=A0A3D8Q738_9HELO|nr:hypothetical protein BP6252_13715 [Coleophoma cylindrospora]